MSQTAFTIRLERVFHGPMDLLLHLVREQEVEIAEVEISRVIKGYLQHLDAMRDLDIEVAGDFLVMAATLMAIKSRSLLPRESVDLEDGLDPRDELIQRLMEYRRFREASDRLGEAYEIRALQHPRGAAGAEEPVVEPEIDLGEVSSWDLLSAFSRLMRETLAHQPHRIAGDSRPLRYYVKEMAQRIRSARELTLRELVFAIDPEPTRESLIGGFCALLELAKLGLIRVRQDEPRDQIVLSLAEGHGEDLESVIDSSVFQDEEEEAAGGPASAQVAHSVETVDASVVDAAAEADAELVDDAR